MLSIYTSLPHWNTQCMFDFGKKSMCECYLKAIFCYLHGFEILHRVNLTELTLFFSSAGDFSLSSVFPPCQCDSCSGFCFFFCSEKQKRSLASFLFSLPLSLFSLSAVFCEQTITCWRNNKSLLGNGTTSWEFCFQLINLMYLKFRSF